MRERNGYIRRRKSSTQRETGIKEEIKYEKKEKRKIY